MAPRCAVYCILNVKNGKRYIGSSENPKRRLWYHRWLLNRGGHHSVHLQRAWQADGEETFAFSIIEFVADQSKLLQREQFWLDTFQSADERFGYNLCAVAGTRRGVPQPASVGEKMRAVHAGRPKTLEHRAKISAARKGHVKSPEHRQKLREAATRQMADPQRRALASVFAKMAKKNIGNG